MRRWRRRRPRRVRSAACAVAEPTIDLTVPPQMDATIMRPGDTLVIRVNATTRQAVDEIKANLSKALPDDIKVVIMANVEQLLVYRPAGGDDE